MEYENVALNNPTTTSEDIMRECAAPELFIGMRGHAQLIPFGCGTPTLSLISHDKLKWFLDDVKHAEWEIDVNDDDLENKIIATAQKMIENKAEIKKHIAEAMDEFYEILLENVSELYRTIGVKTNLLDRREHNKKCRQN